MRDINEKGGIEIGEYLVLIGVLLVLCVVLGWELSIAFGFVAEACQIPTSRELVLSQTRSYGLDGTLSLIRARAHVIKDNTDVAFGFTLNVPP